VYVWLDALSKLTCPRWGLGEPETALYERYWPAALHLVGKDILRFQHASTGRRS